MEELHGSFEEKIAYLKEQLRADENFDIIYRSPDKIFFRISSTFVNLSTSI